MGALVVVLGLCIVYLVYTHKTSIIEGVDSDHDACAKAQSDCNTCLNANLRNGTIGREQCKGPCQAAGELCGST